jgi:2-polyprenyl-3-methyl-5-hydroxy-6-metoxy-1,4-benzoquinol methylase
MQTRHKRRTQYFKEQEQTTKKFVIPLLKKHTAINKTTSVLEIGCGEAGNLKPFVDLGCQRVVGIDKTANKIENAKTFTPPELVRVLS